MNIPTHYKSELSSLDSDLNKLGSADFIRAMHEPDSEDRLTRVLDYLIESWPTSEETQNFKKHIMDSQGGSMRVDDSDTLKKLGDTRIANEIADYKSGKQAVTNKATLFINLFGQRPTSLRLFELYRQTEDVKSTAEAIFKTVRTS